MQPTYPKPKDYKNRDAGPLAHVGTAMAGAELVPNRLAQPGTRQHQLSCVSSRPDVDYR